MTCSPAACTSPHQVITGIRYQRRPSVTNKCYSLSLRQALQQLIGDRLLRVFVIGYRRRRHAQMQQQILAVASVLGGDKVRVLENFDGSQ